MQCDKGYLYQALYHLALFIHSSVHLEENMFFSCSDIVQDFDWALASAERVEPDELAEARDPTSQQCVLQAGRWLSIE